MFGLGSNGEDGGGIEGRRLSAGFMNNLTNSSRSAALLLSELGRPPASMTSAASALGDDSSSVGVGGVGKVMNERLDMGDETDDGVGGVPGVDAAGDGVYRASAASSASAGALLAAHHSRTRHQTYLASAASGRNLLASSLNFMELLPKPANTDISPAPPKDTIAMSSNNPDLDSLRQKLKEEEEQLTQMINVRRKRRLELEHQEQQQLLNPIKKQARADTPPRKASSTADSNKPSSSQCRITDAVANARQMEACDGPPQPPGPPVVPVPEISREEMTDRIKRYLLRVYFKPGPPAQENNKTDASTKEDDTTNKETIHRNGKDKKDDTQNKDNDDKNKENDNKNVDKDTKLNDEDINDKDDDTKNGIYDDATESEDENPKIKDESIKNNKNVKDDTKNKAPKDKDSTKINGWISINKIKLPSSSLPPPKKAKSTPAPMYFDEERSEKLAQVLAKLIEKRMHKASPSFTVYSDPTTIQARIQHHAVFVRYRIYRFQTHKQHKELAKLRHEKMETTLGPSQYKEISNLHKELTGIEKRGTSWQKGRIRDHEELKARDAVPPAIASLYFPKDGGLQQAVRRVDDAIFATTLEEKERIDDVDWSGLLKKAKSTLTSYRRMEMRQLKLEVEEVQRQLQCSQPGLTLSYQP